jgi:hypothetical protein
VPGEADVMIISGRPTPAETAVVVAVLAALAARAAGTSAAGTSADGTSATGTSANGTSAWAARSRLLRPAIAPGPGAWRASALPR